MGCPENVGGEHRLMGEVDNSLNPGALGSCPLRGREGN